MRGLAAFIMRGRLSALGVLFAVSLVPVLGWLSGAVLALVGLRRGPVEGLLLALAAALATALLLGLAFGTPALAAQPLLELWLPVLVLAGWLRYTVSLSSTLRLAAVLAAMAILILHLAIPDQAAYWGEFLLRMERLFTGGEGQEAWRLMRERLLPVMAGLVVLSQLGVVLASLLLGRWWQSLVYNPGGFRQEFHGLDLGRGFGIAAAVLLALAAWQGTGLAQNIALVAAGVFVLQALALAHAAVAARGMSGAWLIGLYLLLPFGFELLAVVGIAGAVFGWRRRIRERTDAGGGPV